MLRVLAFNLQGEEDLLYLAFHRPILCQIGVFRELLRDRRTALGNRPAGEIGIGGAQDAARINPHMLVKAVVLNRNESILQILRNLREFDRLAVFRRMDIGDLVAIDVIDMGRCWRTDVFDKIVLCVHARGQKATANANDHDENNDEETHESAQDIAGASSFFRRRLRSRLRR